MGGAAGARAGDGAGARVRRAVGVALLLVVWLGLTLLAAVLIFSQSSRTLSLASHDAVVRPSFTGDVVVHSGPVLPDVRLDSGSIVGVDVTLGKTDVGSIDELVQRYGVIAGSPEGQEARVIAALRDMAYDAVLRGAVVGLLPIGVWLLVGRSRRRELLRRVPTRQGLLVGLVVAGVVVAVWQPWEPDAETVESARPWQPLGDFLGPSVPLPDSVQGIEVRGDVTTLGTRRLIESAVDTYDKSKTFYADAATAAAELALREPSEGDTVVALLSDRHDNIGMDAVARAVAEAGGASAVFDAGDDTSTGKPWEAFSLDSLDAAFGDLDERWAIAGNHDNGTFVDDYLQDRGWTGLDGEVVDGPGGTTLLGVDDPRASGLGSWRDESGLSFTEVTERLADAACAAEEDGERVTTLLVHDANLGKLALERGCTDLVVGGHLHVQVGPDRVVGDNGRAGYSYTNGTTGGAAYAIAVGSKPKREAMVSLITYTDGRPSGIQAVTLQTNGVFTVGDWVPLDLG